MDSKKEASDLRRSRQDHVTSFIMEFNQLKQALELELEAMERSDSNDSDENIAKLFTEFESLKKLLGNSTHFLPSYNIKAAQESLNSIGQRINAKRDSLRPKKKFGFKRSNVPKKEQLMEIDGDVIDPTVSSTAFTSKDASFLGFRNEKASQLSLHSADVFKKDVNLENLVDCDVNIFGSPSTIHMKNLQNCRVNSGPVETSVFIVDSNACVFNLACQQLRIHATTDSIFNIHVTSRCIIEDCKKLSFARWDLGKWTYDGIEKDFEVSNLDVGINNWQKILDFNWLAVDKPSPNWSLIDE